MNRTLTFPTKKPAARSVVFSLFAGAVMLMSAMAEAQEGRSSQREREDLGLFGNIGRWFDEQGEKFGSTFKDTGKGVENFGREAGVAAKSTVSGAKDAADAVVRIPGTRVISGHAKCHNAPNGAPDCVAAANSVCKAKGFETGKSLDMTTAVVCPPKVLLSGSRGGAECKDETFVSRALCQ
jgi:hypothetical protein